ncbi:nitroreductase family deazaflavin-dependent oxidoreductase [Mycobacterium sp. 050134]|uniref:nitroreductase family deazaflavin-dependent oxidoreductase n=1 Tax=Mycobacterium sp. 050134 TaxID=3096111 RepID=UPI002ED89EAD
MTDRPDIGDVKEFNSALIEEFRANGGKVTGQFASANLLLLTTTGARSGQARVSPLAYFRIDGRLIIIGSFAGSPKDPAWVHNLRANPRARVEVGADTGVQALDVAARELSPAEREDILPKVVAAAPVVAEYQANTSRVIPLFELQPAA